MRAAAASAATFDSSIDGAFQAMALTETTLAPGAVDIFFSRG
jgi:hypothetical protein